MSGGSGDSYNTGARMLERRVSNNRADLSGDQRMNYFLAWFNQWSELQKSDFVKVLSEKMCGGTESMSTMVNGGVSNGFDSLNMNGGDEVKRPPSLFACQIKLFREWFSGWSDDQKNYLVMRLQAVDGEFYAKYEKYVSDPGGAEKGLEKDYFEPGVPPEMVRKSSRSVLGPHAMSPTPPAVGFTSNHFSGISSIESALPATIEEKTDCINGEGQANDLEDESNGGNDSENDSDDELRKAKNHVDSEIDGGLDRNYDQHLSTIAE